LAIAYIAFLSLFAFDSGSLLGILIQLIPSYTLIAALVVAWKNQKLGGVIFMMISLFFLIFFHAYKEVVPFVLVCLIPFSIGVTFYVSDKNK